jgi:cell migration-inducing and hyaluronan-binding protein
MTTRAPASGEAVLPSDTRPSTFWITNPDNTYRNNHAAGSRGIGFWYALPAAPTGLSTGQPDLPRRTPLREFSGNVAHSNRSVGLNVDDGPRPDGTTETTNYSPRQDPANDSPVVPADFTGLRAWKNQGRGVWLRGNSHRLSNAVLADNGIGATFASSETWVMNSTFIGESGNNGVPAGFYRGYEFYDGRVGAENVKFANFTKVGTIPSSALGYNRNNSFPINTGNFARGLSFTNANEVYLENPGADRDGDKAAAFWDETGSVTGQAGVYVLANVPFMLDGSCTYRTAWNSHVCTGRRINLRVNNNGPEPVGPFTVTRDDAQALTLVGVPDARTTATTTVVPNRGYAIAWGTPGIPPKPRFYLNRGVPGEYLQVSFPYPGGTHRVVRDYNNNNPIGPAADLAALNAGTGGWFYDAGTSTMHLKLQVQASRDYATLFVEVTP